MVVILEATIAFMQVIDPQAVAKLVGEVRETETGVKYLVVKEPEEIYKRIIERK